MFPQNTTLLVNIWGVLHDHEHWGDPEVFRPERFLDADGRFIKDEWMIQFGAGKRVCLGEILARNMLFLIFSTLMQEFTFRIPKGDPDPLTDALPGFTAAPAPFRVEVMQR
jgi:methyl farnesoate epoxidase/farnesoate epoxidase